MYERQAQRLIGETWSAFTTRERTLLAVGAVICACLSVAMSRALGVPEIPKFSASLLAGPAPFNAIIVTAVIVAACTLIGSVVAIFLRLEAGLLCATFGLAALSVRGGPMSAILRSAAGPAVYLTLAVEIILLVILLAGAWIVLQRIAPVMFAARPPASGLQKQSDGEISSEPGDIAFAIGVNVVAMILCLSLLLQTDFKKQALVSVGVSSLIGTLAACQIAPLVAGMWYWLAPPIVGIIGYALAFASPQDWQIGEVHGMLGALARAVPLDYTSLGVAGAILGYWTARKWKEEGEMGQE